MLRDAVEELPPHRSVDSLPPGEDGEVVPHHPAEEEPAPRVQLGMLVDVVEYALVLVEDVEVLAAAVAKDVAGTSLAVVDADPVQDGDAAGCQQRRIRPGVSS